VAEKGGIEIGGGEERRGDTAGGDWGPQGGLWKSGFFQGSLRHE